MDGKKIKIITIVSLGLVAFSVIVTLVLLYSGLFGKAFANYESTGNTSIDISNGCARGVVSVVVLFAVWCKVASLLVGGLSCIAKKRRLSIATASIFACIMAVLSALIGIFAFASFVPLAGSDGYAVFAYFALILMPLTDLFWFGVAIYRAVKLSKALKLSIG